MLLSKILRFSAARRTRAGVNVRAKRGKPAKGCQPRNPGLLGCHLFLRIHRQHLLFRLKRRIVRQRNDRLRLGNSLRPGRCRGRIRDPLGNRGCGRRRGRAGEAGDTGEAGAWEKPGAGRSRQGARPLLRPDVHHAVNRFAPADCAFAGRDGLDGREGIATLHPGAP